MTLPTKTMWRWVEEQVDWGTNWRMMDVVWGNPSPMSSQRGMTAELLQLKLSNLTKLQWVSR